MRIAILGASLLIFALTAAPAYAQPTAVDDALTRVVADNDLAGGIAVVRDGAGLTRSAAGYSDVDTRRRFAPQTHVRAASITKTFVAATILQLVAEGKLDLDTPIETYLPGRIHGEGIDANAITVRQLLRHQSGLPEYFDDDTPPPTDPVTADQLLDAALTRPAQFAPGTAMKYTNTNYVIAGLLIEKLTGRPPPTRSPGESSCRSGFSDTYFPAPGDTGTAPAVRARLRTGRRRPHRRHGFQRLGGGHGRLAGLDQRGHLGVHHRPARRPGHPARATGRDDADCR